MKKIFLLLLFSFVVLHLNADVFKINEQQDATRKFYTYLKFFKDINGTYNKTNLEQLSKETFFKADKERQHLGLSFQSKSLWTTFQVFNNSNKEQTRVVWFKNITYEDVSLLEKNLSNVKEIPKVNGVNDFYFELHLEPHTYKEYYAKIKANGPYIIDTKLMHTDEANIFNYENGLFFASFAAFMFIVIVFYVALFIGLKRRMYLYFALYSVSHLLFWLAIYGVYKPFDFSLLKVITLGSSSLFIALVTFDFLNMRQKMRTLYKMIITVLIILFGYYIFAYYLQLSVFQPMIFALFYFVTYLLILIAIIKAIINKHKAALYYLFAIAGYFIGYNITIGGVYASALIPANAFTMHVGMLGVVLDVFFVTIAFIIAAKNVYTAQKNTLEEYSKLLESKVKDRTKKIEEQNLALKKLSSTDTLTQLSNRLELDRKIKELYDSNEKNLYLILLDIDYFKKVNDTYGHLVGDSVLKQIAKILRKSLKEKDTIGRWGGEEFLVPIKAKDDATVLSIAQRIRKNIASDLFEQDIKITVSLGISSINNVNSMNEWLRNSDEALYEAKESGRDRVVIKG